MLPRFPPGFTLPNFSLSSRLACEAVFSVYISHTILLVLSKWLWLSRLWYPSQLSHVCASAFMSHAALIQMLESSQHVFTWICQVISIHSTTERLQNPCHPKCVYMIRADPWISCDLWPYLSWVKDVSSIPTCFQVTHSYLEPSPADSLMNIYLLCSK